MPTIGSLAITQTEAETLGRTAALDTDLRLILRAIEHIDDAVVITTADETHEVVFANPAFEAISGRRTADIQGRGVGTALTGLDDAAVPAVLRGALQAMTPHSGDLEVVTADGERRAVELRLTPIAAAGGSPSHWFWMMRRQTGGRDQLDFSDVQPRLLAGSPRDEILRSLCTRMRDATGCERLYLRLIRCDMQIDEHILEPLGQPQDGLHQGDAELVAAAVEAGRVAILDLEDPHHVEWAGRLADHGLGGAAIVPFGQGAGALQLYWGPVGPSARPSSEELTEIGRRLAETVRQLEHHELVRITSQAMAATANAVFITDTTGRIIWVNEAFENLSGYLGDELHGQKPDLFKSGLHDDAYFADLWGTLCECQVWRGETVNRRKNGTLYVVEQTITPVEGADGRTAYLVAVHDDITARKETEKRVEHLAHHDALTDLPNRSLFRDRLMQSIAATRRNGTLLALMFIDLDRFKDVNDTLGHDCGDGLLRMVAQRLKGCVRETDTVARLGGDEFAVIQPGVHSVDDVSLLASRIIRTLAEPYVVLGHDVHSSASIGITLCPGDSLDPDELLRNADMAMYRAKAGGRSAYEFFSRDMNQAIQAKLALERALRQSIAEHRFEVHYQPQVELHSNRIIGAEALVRWLHPERGLVSPLEFIPVAEETGLIVPLGELVLNRACHDAQLWRESGLPPLRVSVNASPQQFRDDRLIEQIDTSLRASGLPASALELEITETVLMQNARAVTINMGRLHQRGIPIAIDDFGTGYSSLTYLKRFVVDKLKIDRAFVGEIGIDPNDTAIVKAVIGLARSLGITAIAEGVETAAQAAYLKSQGCHLAQGYHFGRPMPHEEFMDTVRNHTRG